MSTKNINKSTSANECNSSSLSVDDKPSTKFEKPISILRNVMSGQTSKSSNEESESLSIFPLDTRQISSFNKVRGHFDPTDNRRKLLELVRDNEFDQTKVYRSEVIRKVFDDLQFSLEHLPNTVQSSQREGVNPTLLATNDDVKTVRNVINAIGEGKYYYENKEEKESAIYSLATSAGDVSRDTIHF